MRTALAWSLVSSLLAPSVALAKDKEFGVHGGKQALLRVRGVAEKAVKLTPGVGGWYLTLDVPGDGAACTAELRDVSPVPGPLPKWIESVPNVGQSSTITLDPQRYLGTHTYRMWVRCGTRELVKTLVHLLPPADPATKQRFDLAQQPAADETRDDTIVTIPKSAL